MNFLNFSGSVAPEQTQIALSGQDMPVPALRQGASGDLVFGVRPEHVHLSDDGAFRGEVVATEYLGTTQIVTLNTSNGELKARIASDRTASVGESVGIGFRGDTVTLFDRSNGLALRSALNEGVLANG
jgi:multiple sugar transport system ATP-binding protein